MALLCLIAYRLDRTIFKRTPLDLLLLLFLATAVVGIWTAYDRTAALDKFWMLLGASTLFYALAIQPAPNAARMNLLLGALGVAVALFFLLSHDWQSLPAKFTFVQQLARRWTAVRPTLSLTPLHPNVAGGLMAVLLPFHLAALAHDWRVKNRIRAGFLVVLLAVTSLALLLTSSRGAMAALAVGLFSWGLWRLTVKRRSVFSARQGLRILLLALISALALFAVARGRAWQLPGLIDHLPGAASALNRAQLAGQAVDLVADFPLTGGGLAAFPGLYSQYILGIPFFFLPNSHNIVLDIALEQGVLGLLCFLLIISVTFWILFQHGLHAEDSAADPGTSLLAGAALASLVALLGHGLVEDTVYGSVALPLLFVVPGIAVALHCAAHPCQPASPVSVQARRGANLVALTALALVGLIATPQGRALWWADLGAVNMARADLDAFPTGQWLTAQESDMLQNAEAQLQKSLHDNPRQRSALYRLGLLAMRRGDYDTAIGYLQDAYALDRAHSGVRKALGYSYAWTGKLELARQHLQADPFVHQELNAYYAWWQKQGKPELAQITTQMQALLRDATKPTVIE